MSHPSLKENLLFNTMTQGSNAILPLLIQYLIVRRLDLVDIGSLNVLLSMQALFGLVVAAANLHLLAVTIRQSYDKDSLVLSNGTVFGVLCAIPSAIVFVVVALTSNALSARIGLMPVIIAVAMTILLAPFANSFYFQARLLNRQMFARRLISRLALLIGIFWFVRGPEDATTYGVIFSLAIILEYLLAYSKVHRLIDLGTVSLVQQREILFGSLKYLHFNLTYGVLPHYAILLGAGTVAEQSFAEFSVLVKIVNLVTGFITSSVMVLYPFKSTRSQTPDTAQFDRRALLWTVLVAVLAAMCLTLFSELIYILMLYRQDPAMANEFWLLVAYIPVHATFNYYIFNFFIYESRHRFVIFLNTITLSAFALLVTFNDIFNFGLTLTQMMISIALASLMGALWYKSFLLDSRHKT
jgi:hypothetical protein